MPSRLHTFGRMVEAVLVMICELLRLVENLFLAWRARLSRLVMLASLVRFDDFSLLGHY